MSRPPSTDGGRPVRLTIRLSEAEADALDAARGTMKRVDYVRSLLPRPTKRSARTVLGVVADTIEQPASIPTPTTAAPSVISSKPDPSPVVVTERHYCKPPDPKKVEKWTVRGVAHTRYTCACGRVVTS